MTQGPGADFMGIKELRNSIVHFSSSHTTFEHANVIVRGLADTTDYDALYFEKARVALFAAEDMIGEIFLLSGVVPENIPHMLHAWTGATSKQYAK